MIQCNKCGQPRNSVSENSICYNCKFPIPAPIKIEDESMPIWLMGLMIAGFVMLAITLVIFFTAKLYTPCVNQ